MRKYSMNTVNPYIWYGLGMSVLCAAFFIIYLSSVKDNPLSKPLIAAEQKPGSAKVFTSPVSYNVVEDYKVANAALPQYAFGTLQISKSKVNRGMQLLAKHGHVHGQYAAPDGAQMVYFIHRLQQQEKDAWTQVDMVSIDPQTQKMVLEPIGYTYGEHPDLVAQSTGLSGYLSNDEFLYTTVKNEDSEWVYLVNKFNLTHKTVTPVMELLRYQSKNNGGKPPVIYSSQLTPDKLHLFVRDSINGLSSYDLSTGEKKWATPGSNELKPGEYFETLGDSGVGLYSVSRYQSDVWWIDLSTGASRQPFTAEQGFIDVGMDVKGKMMYYNFTYDRAPENLITGDKQTLLISRGVQMMDVQGNPLKRFSLPKDSKERLEFGGYSETKKAVLLHKFTVAVNSKGQPYKKTEGWMLGDMNTGVMTMLNKVDVPDSWDKKDIIFGKATIAPSAPSAEQQVFVNFMENSYYMCRWKTKQVLLLQDEDFVMYADELSKRVFVSSFTRPDLVVAALNYKKYNWDNQKFSWLKGHWLARYQNLPDGVKMYFIQLH